MKERIRAVLAEHGHLSTAVGDDANLYAAGMSSHAAVNVMIALEDAFEVEFLDSQLRREVFESVEAISRALEQVGAPA